MKFLSTLVLLLAIPLGYHAQANATKTTSVSQKVDKATQPVKSEEPRWSWWYSGGEYIYLYLDGWYYATWSYRANRYVHFQHAPAVTSPRSC